MCREKIFQLQSMFNFVMIICVNQCFAVENSGVSCQTCLTSIFNLSNLNPKTQQAKNWIKLAKYNNDQTVSDDSHYESHNTVFFDG